MNMNNIMSDLIKNIKKSWYCVKQKIILIMKRYGYATITAHVPV